MFTAILKLEKFHKINLAMQLDFVPSDEKTVSGFRHCVQISMNRIARNKWRGYDVLREDPWCMTHGIVRLTTAAARF